MNRDRLFLLLNNMTEKRETRENIVEKICTILSNHTDYVSAEGGLLSVKKFNAVAEDIIDYFKLYKEEV